jgi:adenylosuccinate lyase
MLVAYENVNLWHERDISHSSVERVIIPDSTIIADYMIKKCEEVVKGLRVNRENMLNNIELNRGLIYSQKILLKLMEKGLPRMIAYDIVQRVSLDVINNNSNFEEEVIKDAEIKKYLTAKETEEIFNPYTYLNNIDKIYKRAGLQVS